MQKQKSSCLIAIILIFTLVLLFNEETNNKTNITHTSSSYSRNTNNLTSNYSYNNNSSKYLYGYYNIGDKIITDKFEITVMKVEEKSIVGDYFISESAGEGNIYICCKIKIKNISNKPVGMFSQPSFCLVDGKDVTYSIDISASSLYGSEADDTSKTLSDLNPGVTIYDTGVFQLGKDYYARNNFSLKISADKTITVKIK